MNFFFFHSGCNEPGACTQSEVFPEFVSAFLFFFKYSLPHLSRRQGGCNLGALYD